MGLYNLFWDQQPPLWVPLAKLRSDWSMGPPPERWNNFGNFFKWLAITESKESWQTWNHKAASLSKQHKTPTKHDKTLTTQRIPKRQLSNSPAFRVKQPKHESSTPRSSVGKLAPRIVRSKSVPKVHTLGAWQKCFDAFFSDAAMAQIREILIIPLFLFNSLFKKYTTLFFFKKQTRHHAYCLSSCVISSWVALKAEGIPASDSSERTMWLTSGAFRICTGGPRVVSNTKRFRNTPQTSAF